MRQLLAGSSFYDMIWDRGISKVARELAVSDVALRKHCLKHAI